MSARRIRRPKVPTTSLLSTGVVDETAVFSDPACCDILIRAMESCQKRYGFDVLAFAILPEHFQWIVHLGRGRATVSDVMRDLKNLSAREIMAYLGKEHSYGALTVFARNARRLLDQRRRFWRPHFEETVIGDLETLRERIKAVLDEPVRRGLAAQASDYHYCSAGGHLGEKPTLAVTPLSELEWIA